MNTLNCLRCGEQMQFLSREEIQLGKTGWLLGDLPNLIAGALAVNIFMCPKCHKLEFYAGEEEALTEDIPKRICPSCGTSHDFDYPKCPNCKYDYYKN